MYTTCTARGCGKATKGYGKYCNAHSKRNIRHGHPMQLGISKGDLLPYRKEVRRFLDGRADPETWNKAIDRLKLVADRCQETLQVFDSGQPMNRWEVGSARMFLMVCSDVDPKVIIETCAGMGLMHEREPRRFMSDEAFFAQLCRRFTGLTTLGSETYWNEKTQQLHRCYGDTPPRVAAILGRTLMVTVGTIGVYIAKAEAERARVDRAARNELFAALASGEVDRV